MNLLIQTDDDTHLEPDETDHLQAIRIFAMKLISSTVAFALRTSLLASIAWTCAGAQAQETAFLDPAGAEQLVVGKKVTFMRQADSQRVRWQIDKGGLLFGENLSLNSRDTARWTIDDKGLCLKWRGNSTDRCLFFSTHDGKTEIFDVKTKDAVMGVVETIE